MNKCAPFALALALVSCETPLRPAEASGTFFKCINDEIIHRDWGTFPNGDRGTTGYSHYSPTKRDYDFTLRTRYTGEGTSRDPRQIRYKGDTLYYRGKKCREMTDEEIQAMRWRDCEGDWCKPPLRIPAQYRGEWCTATEDPTGPTQIYKRCGKSAVWDQEIRAWRFFTPDVSCKVIKITKLRIGHRIQFVCEGETENGAGNEHWRLSADGRLIVSDL
jgi:hypothetical protein